MNGLSNGSRVVSRAREARVEADEFRDWLTQYLQECLCSMNLKIIATQQAFFVQLVSLKYA